jgi:hypothetical protein
LSFLLFYLVFLSHFVSPFFFTHVLYFFYLCGFISSLPPTCLGIKDLVVVVVVLEDFLFPSKEASFTLSDSAPSLKESHAVSEESLFCSTESSATLKESPPLEETPGPRGLAILSDKNHVNSENSHLSHVGLFTTIILYLFDQLF